MVDADFVIVHVAGELSDLTAQLLKLVVKTFDLVVGVTQRFNLGLELGDLLLLLYVGGTELVHDLVLYLDAVLVALVCLSLLLM
jgi:hypothetical protein